MLLVPFLFFSEFFLKLICISLSFFLSKLQYVTKLQYIIHILYPWQTLLINHDTAGPFRSRYSLGVLLSLIKRMSIELGRTDFWHSISPRINPPKSGFPSLWFSACSVLGDQWHPRSTESSSCFTTKKQRPERLGDLPRVT